MNYFHFEAAPRVRKPRSAAPVLLLAMLLAWCCQGDAAAQNAKPNAKPATAQQQVVPARGYSTRVCDLSTLLDMDEQAINRRFGSPTRHGVTEQPNRQDATLVNKLHVADFAMGTRIRWLSVPDGTQHAKNLVLDVEVTSKAVDAGGGLRVGSSRTQALRIFGKTEDGDETSLRWGCDTARLQVSLQGGRVVKIHWSAAAD